MAYFSGNNASSNSNGNSGGDYDDEKLKVSPFTVIRGTLEKAFGIDKSWGQSLAITMSDVRLVEGCLYEHAEKGNLKTFSWDDIVGVMPGNDEGIDVSEDDARPIYKKTYGSNDVKYKLVDARISDESEPVQVGSGEIIMYHGGTDENGPSAASLRLATLLHPNGNDNVLSDEDIYNWLSDVSGDNFLRDDIRGGEFDFFIEKRDSNSSDFKYHQPKLIKTSIGEEVAPVANSGGNSAGNNQNGSEAGGTLDGDDESDTETTEAPSGSTDAVPGPVNDFLTTAGSLGMDDAESQIALLDDLVSDPENDITQGMVDEMGGQDAVIEMV